MSTLHAIGFLVLSIVASSAADEPGCPSQNMGTSNVILLTATSPAETYTKCEGSSCLGYQTWAALCRAAFLNNWKMVSWKGSTFCFHAPGYTYQGSNVQSLYKGALEIDNVGSCDGSGWPEDQLTEEVCRCGVPRDFTTVTTRTTSTTTTTTIRVSSTPPVGTTISSEGTTTSSQGTIPMTSTVSSSDGTTPDTLTTTEATTFLSTGEPVTTTATPTTTGACTNTTHVDGLFEFHFHDLLPGACGFVPLLVGAAVGLALSVCCGVAVLHCRRGSATYGASGHISVPLTEGYARDDHTRVAAE